MARQKKLTAKLAQKILDYFADGFTIREVFLKDDVDITWSNFRNYLIADDLLMLRYQKSKELAVDLKLSELEDKRKILEINNSKFLPLICYEIIYSGNLNQNGEKFNFILNIS